MHIIHLIINTFKVKELQSRLWISSGPWTISLDLYSQKNIKLSLNTPVYLECHFEILLRVVVFFATSQRFPWFADYLVFLFRLNEGKRRGRLKSVITVRFSTRLSSATPSVLAKLMGKECVRSQWRREAMSCSMASIWKWVPMMLHTWNSWWLWPLEGAKTVDLNSTVWNL